MDSGDSQSEGDETVETVGTETFERELDQLLSRHGRKMEDLRRGPASDIPEATKRQIVEHIHTVSQASDRTSGHSYRRLRTFSGMAPVPNGELSFNIWIQHADQMVRETSLSEQEKRSSVAESLAPPALTVYRKAIKSLGTNAAAVELLQQLGQAFGIACEGDDLFTLFRETFQNPGEKPSEYLTRLEDRLDTAVQVGDVDPKETEKLCLNQFVRGCIFNETWCRLYSCVNVKSNPLILYNFSKKCGLRRRLRLPVQPEDSRVGPRRKPRLIP